METSLPIETAPSPPSTPSNPIPVASLPTTTPQITPPSPPEKEQVFLTWRAPNRPYKKHDREYYTTIAVIVFLLSIIMFFAGQFLLIAVIISFGFVSYVLAAVPPEVTTYAITTYGVRIGEKLYHWNELGRFWFTTRLGQRILHIEYLTGRFSSSLVVVLGDTKEEQLTSLLLNYLPNETPLPTFVEKASTWLQEKLPLDKTG